MSQCNECCRTPCACMDGDETERAVTTNTDPEAIAREVERLVREALEAERIRCTRQADRDAARRDAAYLDLRAQLDSERAQVARFRDAFELQGKEVSRLMCALDDTLSGARDTAAECDSLATEVERLKAIIEARDEADGAPYRCGRCDGGCNDLYGSGPDAMCRRCYSAKRDADEVVQLTAEVDRITALYRKADDGHDENMRETARLIGEVDRLTADLATVRADHRTATGTLLAVAAAYNGWAIRGVGQHRAEYALEQIGKALGKPEVPPC